MNLRHVNQQMLQMIWITYSISIGEQYQFAEIRSSLNSCIIICKDSTFWCYERYQRNLKYSVINSWAIWRHTIICTAILIEVFNKINNKGKKSWKRKKKLHLLKLLQIRRKVLACYIKKRHHVWNHLRDWSCSIFLSQMRKCYFFTTFTH